MTSPLPPNEPCLEFEFEFDELPEKVWTAVSIDAYRRRWLPDQTVIEVLREEQPRELDLLIEEDQPPHTRGIISFRISSNGNGGTVFAVRHQRATNLIAANDPTPTMMRAA